MAPQPAAIDLGTGEYIPLEPLQGNLHKALNLDALAPGLEPLWSALERVCVASCCGIDAFDFSPPQIHAARSSLPADAIRQQLASLLAALPKLLTQQHTRIVVSARLNQYLDREALLPLLRHLLDHL